MIKALVCSERIVEKVMGPPLRGFVHSSFASAANLIFADGFWLSLNSFPHPTPNNNYYIKKEMLSENAGCAGIFAQHLFFYVDKDFLSLMPNGLLLSANAGEWPFVELRAGMAVVLGAGWLVIEAI